MNFLLLYVMILVASYVFCLFGGHMLFDFKANFFVALAVCAFIIAVVVFNFISQNEKINKLEKRIKELEEKER